MSALRKIRLHLEERNGRLRKAARLLFTGRDASLYLIPYARKSTYFYGKRSMASGQTEDTVNFREQLSASTNPKLSIHESGQVHIHANDQPKAGPLRIPHLTEFRGEHIATVHWDAIGLVPEMRGKPKITASEQDWAFGVPDHVKAGALLLYANGEHPAFMGSPIQVVFQLERGPEPPVFFGLMAVQKDPLGDEIDEGGVTVLAGFDPHQHDDEEADYLYLRGL